MSKYSLSTLLSQGFSELAVEDLEKSGLSLETVERMKLLPLTPESFKEYLHFSLVEKATREQIVLDGYVIPYPSPVKFGRLKVLRWNESSQYVQNRKELPKYLQPSSQHISNPLKLYHIPDVNVKSPKKVFFITEGEKKTAKLQQELEKIDERFVALGLGGVWNWNETTFSEADVSFRDRKVFIVFDADGKENPSVARAELRLYGYLLSKGAVSVKSFVWDAERGKGIDDYLTACENETEELEKLLSSAVSPIEKYKDTVSFQTVIEELAENLRELNSQLVEELKKAYSVGKREIKRKFQVARERKRKEIEERLKKEEEKKLLEIYRELFGIDFIPEFPKGYRIENKLLYCGDEDVCNAFVVSEVGENVDEIDGGYLAVLNFLGGKKVKILSNVIASSKLLVNYLQQEKIAVSERESKKVQDYITKFIRKNSSKLKKNYYSTRIGWSKIDGEFVYVHPEVSNVSLLINKEIEEKLHKSGSKEEELKAVRELVSRFPAVGLLWSISVASSILYPVFGNDCNVLVFVQGETGTGKTTAIKTAVSFYASPSLKRSFNFSEGGFEGFISSLKDFPIHLEEIKEIDRNPTRRAEKFVDFVYKFVEGMGKTRMKIDLSLRNTATYRGLIFTSSEMGIDEILSHSSDSYYEGIFRRVLVISAGKETFGGEQIGRLSQVFLENHGNLLSEWIEHFKQNRKKIIERFKERDADFSEVYKLDAKIRRFLALVSVVMEEVGELLKIDVLPLWDALESVGSFNEKLYREYILGDEESFKRRVEDFLTLASSNNTIVEQENLKERPELTLRDCKGEFWVYRRITKDDGEITSSKTFLTSLGINQLCKSFGMGKETLLRKLREFNLIQDRKQLTVLTLGKRVWMYPIVEEVNVPEVPDTLDVPEF